MSLDSNASAARIYGQVQRETNRTLIFISEEGRRIRFRYIGLSPQYPRAAVYQCTQCKAHLVVSESKTSTLLCFF